MGAGFTVHCEEDKDFGLKLQQGRLSVDDGVLIIGGQ